MINKVLEQIKELLAEEPIAQFLDLLYDNTLPTNSDVVLMLAQFQAAMEQFKTKYYGYNPVYMEHEWNTK